MYNLRLQYSAAAITFFGIFFYIGFLVQSGKDFDGPRGIVGMLAGLLNLITESIGEFLAGFSIMGLAVFGLIYTLLIIWNEK